MAAEEAVEHDELLGLTRRLGCQGDDPATPWTAASEAEARPHGGVRRLAHTPT